MPRYAYSGRDRSGSAAQGDLEAPSRRDALRVLGSRGVQVSSVTELNAPAATQDKKTARTKRAAEKAVAREEAAGSFQLSFSTKKDTSPRAAERLPFLEALYDLTTSGLSARRGRPAALGAHQRPAAQALVRRPVGTAQRGRPALPRDGGLSRGVRSVDDQSDPSGRGHRLAQRDPPAADRLT